MPRLCRIAEIPSPAPDEYDKPNETPWVREQITALIEKRHRMGEAGTHGTLIAINEDSALMLPGIASRLFAGTNRVVHSRAATCARWLAQSAALGMTSAAENVTDVIGGCASPRV